MLWAWQVEFPHLVRRTSGRSMSPACGRPGRGACAVFTRDLGAGRGLGAAVSVLAIVTLGVMTACSGLGGEASGPAAAGGSHATSVSSAPKHVGRVPSSGHPSLSAVELEAEDPLPGGQFVLVVVGGRSFDLACWSLRVGDRRSATVVPGGGRVPSGGVVKLVTELPDPARIALVAPDGRVADRTPLLIDSGHDDRMWFRAGGRWRFGRAPETAGEVVDATLTRSIPSAC